MPRLARLNIKTKEGVYHVISRLALRDEYFTDSHKDYFLNLIKFYTSIYFANVFGFCIMGNHFHLIVQMHDGSSIPDQEIKERFEQYRKSCVFTPLLRLNDPQDYEKLRKKWGNLSELVKELKLAFTRYYNSQTKRKGFLWGGRFKSTLLQKGDALINCMAYIDLNPIRAGIVSKPEDYRWNSLYYRVVQKNKNHWLKSDYFISDLPDQHPHLSIKTEQEKLIFYRKYLYQMGKENHYKIYGGEAYSAHTLSKNDYESAKENHFQYTFQERFLHRCRYFSDSVIVGSHEFVQLMHSQYTNIFPSKRKRRFAKMKGFEQIYSMRDLRKGVAA